MNASSFTAAQQRLNAALTEALATAGCRSGRLQVRPLDAPDEPGLVVLLGHQTGAPDLEVWPLAENLLAQLTAYDAELPPARNFLTVDVALDPPAFAYHYASAQELAGAEAQLLQTRHHYLRRHLSAAPYGAELAAQVAEALAQGRWFGYGHPAYCGMGLELADGQYRYGPVWEGTLEPALTFPDQATFSAWLARQSDLDLALLDSPDYTLWHNQTVTRARLLALIQPPPAA